jgi:ubiquitin carboxyl-terminal hydrolase 26/29/37
MAATSNKWRGLRNDGNSCYVNSSLQQLFSVPSFMQAMSRRKEGHKLAATLSDLHADLLGKSAIESSMHRDNAGSARQVKKVIDQLTDRFHGHQQRDAHEFLGELIDQIHEELTPPSTGNGGNGNESKGISSQNKVESPRNDKDFGAKLIEPTDEFFRWNVQVCLKCKKCGYSRCKEEMYRYLSIDIGHDNANPRDPSFVKPAVDSCLANFFAPEDREVNCEKCKDGKIATQTMKILSMPKVILLHLKRFIAVERLIAGRAGETELVFKKNKIPVELTTNLSVNKLLTDHYSPGTTSALPPNNYRLKSIVHHIGNTANSGHYTTDALKTDPDDGRDLWVSFDDGISVERSLENVVSTTKHQETAYMLLYSMD